jgi:hypothetical protein
MKEIIIRRKKAVEVNVNTEDINKAIKAIKFTDRAVMLSTPENPPSPPGEVPEVTPEEIPDAQPPNEIPPVNPVEVPEVNPSVEIPQRDSGALRYLWQ